MTAVATIARVLVGVDFDEASATAVKMAGSLAAASGAALIAFHAAIEDVPAYFTATQIGQLEAERAQSRVAVAGQVRGFAAQQGVTAVTVVIGEGAPADAILHVAASSDLIVLGTHRRHGPTRWWLGSVAEGIVRRSPCPVLVVPSGVSMPDRDGHPAILVAGEEGPATGAWAGAIETALDGRIIHSPDIHQCAPERLERADLIVLSMPGGENPAQFTAITRVLRECTRPVLFVPSSAAIVERKSS